MVQHVLVPVCLLPYSSSVMLLCAMIDLGLSQYSWQIFIFATYWSYSGHLQARRLHNWNIAK